MEDEVLVIQNERRYSDSSDSDDEDPHLGGSAQIFKNRAFDQLPANASPTLRRSTNISINMNLHLTGSNYDLDAVLKEDGLRVYRRLGVYRSLGALSFVMMLQKEDAKEEVCAPSASSKRSAVTYDVILVLVFFTLIAVHLISSLGFNIDPGEFHFVSSSNFICIDKIHIVTTTSLCRAA
jgi:hypothetical protein